MFFSLFISFSLQIYCIITAKSIFDYDNSTDYELF
jgi:hypothetical protein